MGRISYCQVPREIKHLKLSMLFLLLNLFVRVRPRLALYARLAPAACFLHSIFSNSKPGAPADYTPFSLFTAYSEPLTYFHKVTFTSFFQFYCATFFSEFRPNPIKNAMDQDKWDISENKDKSGVWQRLQKLSYFPRPKRPDSGLKGISGGLDPMQIKKFSDMVKIFIKIYILGVIVRTHLKL